MKKPSLIHKFERWKASRTELVRELEALRKECARLQQKLAVLQQAKDQAEKRAEDRLREKRALRERLTAQKKASESNELQLEQLGARVTELRAENDRLKRAKKK